MYRAGLPVPGARLLAAARLVKPGRPVADIGCDHGKLAVYLAKTGHSPRVLAVDINPLPLAKAKALVAQTGCGNVVECRLGDGLVPLQPGEAQEIVMAGMSGETMAQIVAGAPWVRDAAVHLVLLPAMRSVQLRRWLAQNGFAIFEEVPVQERGRFYTVISAGYTGEVQPQPSALFCEVGLVPRVKTEAAAGYIRRRLADLHNRLCAPMPDEERQALQGLIDEVTRCLP